MIKAWTTLPEKATVEITMAALRAHGMDAQLISKEKVKEAVLALLPEQAEVMTMTSVTLDTLGIAKEINESGHYQAVRPKLYSLDREKQKKEMRVLGTAPDYAVGSVHAATENGELLIASNTGSQLPAYAYGAGKVIFVIGTHKIVKNTEEGLERIYQHSLVLESERAKKAYGVAGSSVNKILIINKEYQAGRITVFFVEDVLGF